LVAIVAKDRGFGVTLLELLGSEAFRAAPFLDTYLKDYIGKTLGAPDEAFAPGSAKRRPELEAL